MDVDVALPGMICVVGWIDDAGVGDICIVRCGGVISCDVGDIRDVDVVCCGV